MAPHKKHYPIRMEDGDLFELPLTDVEVELIQRPVNPDKGGAQKLLWLLQQSLRRSRTGWVTTVTVGILMRLAEYAEFGGMHGGLQTRMPIAAARRAGLVAPERLPLLDDTDDARPAKS